MSALFLVAPQVGASRIEAASRIARRLLSFFLAIEARGHEAAMLATESQWPSLAGIGKLAQLLEKEAPRHVRWLETPTERDAYFVLWPKDGFCDWGEFIAVTDAPGLSAFAATFGKPTRIETTLCEGGMFVRTQSCVLCSSALPKHVALPSGLRALHLPHPYSSDLYRRHQPEHDPLTHLDLDVALIPSEGSPLLLVSERYYNAYRWDIEAACYHLGLEAVEIPQEEVNKRGLNMVVLSKQAVLIPSGCPTLLGLLADRLGSDSVIEIQIDDVFNYNGGRGGLGCMSNVIRRC